MVKKYHMRYLILILISLAFSDVLFAKILGNDKPVIIGQKSLDTMEDQSLAIELTDLYVVDWDNFYPNGFTLNLYPGNHYTISGNTIIPEADYSGFLKVPVTVNDGKDSSKKYDLKIEVSAVNDPPTITGQSLLSTNQDQSIKIQLSNLLVNDSDNDYPKDFTMNLDEGSNYTKSGNTVTPSPGYAGMLLVPVTVNDGSVNSSTFNLEIQVVRTNVAPVITGQLTLATSENKSIVIKLSDLTVSDSDNTYPDDFTLKILSGLNYSAIGNTVIPEDDFTGTLSVRVVVNDGTVDSAPFGLKIEVKPVNRIPQIIGQVPLRINEDESITILLSHLKVTDSDNTFPNGFTLTILSGTDYTILENSVVKPNANFYGNLIISLSVSDGTNVSDPYNLLVIVNPINDSPYITNIESGALVYELGKGSVDVTAEFLAIDVDDDSLSVGEIKFETGSYQSGQDELRFTNTTNIRGVFDIHAGILSLIGKAPIAEYIEAIRSIQYNYDGLKDENLVGNKSLFFSLNDGKNVSVAEQRLIILGDSFVNLDVPTGFTPNGDAVNDTWSVRPLKSMDQNAMPTIRVYNRVGILVYETIGFNEEWDGRFNGDFLPADTYYYTIDLNLPYKQAKYNGLVTILR